MTTLSGCLSLFGLDEPEEAQGPEPAEPTEPASPEPAPVTPPATQNRSQDALVIPPDADARIVQRIAADETVSRTVQISPADVREARFVANVTNLANEPVQIRASASVSLVGEVAARTLTLEPGESRMLNVTVDEAQVNRALRGVPFLPSQVPATLSLTPTGPVDVRGYLQVVEA